MGGSGNEHQRADDRSLSSVRNVLITGSSRGIGLEFLRQYAARGERVFAGCRNSGAAPSVAKLAAEQPDRVLALDLDVTQQAHIDRAIERVRDSVPRLDLLINNAGVMPRGERLGSLAADDLLATFRLNTVAPLLVTQAFSDLLASGGVVVNVSSHLGSLKNGGGGGGYGYSASKAALNMCTQALARELSARNIIVIALTPGWVRTDLGGADAPLSVAQSVTGMIRFIDRLKPRHSGGFFTWKGRRHPW